MKPGLISVIVPFYNSGEYIKRCVESILAQDYTNFELLMIDDGSTDASSELCRAFSQADQRVRVFRQENKGQSAARNLGFDHAEGEYVAFVDSDDYIESGYLSYMLALFSARPESLFTMCNHYVVRGKKALPASDTSAGVRVLTKRDAFEEVLFHGCVDVSPWGKLYRRSVFETLRFPEGRVFEDTYLFGDILLKSEYAVFGSSCRYFYVIHEGSTVRREYSEKNLQYVEAAKQLASAALKCDASLRTGAVRRINHARLSVLRYMQSCPRRYRPARSALRRQVLSDAPEYIDCPKTPRRDRVAVKLLKLGFIPFYAGWYLYNKIR